VETVQFLILGGGPSGLAAAHGLIEGGVPVEQVLILEKEGVGGGLCRSEVIDGAPLDIGGGHFLDVRRKDVLDFLFRFLPREEWGAHNRISKIRLRNQAVDYPLESNLWQLSPDGQIDFLESIAKAGCVNGAPNPESFGEWIVWKLGERIAQEYMLPYNRKIWSVDLDSLGTYWLHKLPNVSFRETLRSCLERRSQGTMPAHARFLYPGRHGYGEVWKRMGDALGNRLVRHHSVKSIDLTTRIVDHRWKARTIISTIPWTVWPSVCQIPENIVNAISRLQATAVDVDYCPETPDDPSHWIYEPDESIRYHRLLLRANFVTGGRGYWTETNAARSVPPTSWRHRNEFAYPLNTKDKPEALEKVLQWAAGHDILGLGRWGRWEHLNSDVAVAESLSAAHRLVARGEST
jgi:protoporphyrinogen oxidase